MPFPLKRVLMLYSTKTGNKTSNLKKSIKNTSANANKSKNVQVDVSKMPHPQPVLIPQTSRSTCGSSAIPSLEELFNFAASSAESPAVFSVDLGAELEKRLPRSVAGLIDHFGGANCSILRHKLVEEFAVAFKNDSGPVVLDGPAGSGKSVLLMQLYAALKASNKQQLLLYAPNAAKWTTGYFSYYPEESKVNDNTENTHENTHENTENTRNTRNSTRDSVKLSYKQPELALEMLQLLTICNPASKLPSGLPNRIDEARRDPFHLAVPLMEQIFAEEKLVVLLDGANGLIDANSSTSYLDANGVALPLRAFPLLRNFFLQSRANVKVVAALTNSNSLLPRHPQSPSNCTVLPVPNYSKTELQAVLNLYKQLGHLSIKSNTGISADQFVNFKAFVSGSNGRKLFKSCEYDSIYSL